MSTGFKEPLVHSPESNQGHYKYRSGLGMMACAEHNIFHEDFVQLITTNVPAGWAAAILDADGTITADTTAAIGANGVAILTSATASAGAAAYMPKAIQLTATKKFFMEMRVYTDDVVDNTFQFGLTDLTAVVNPEDLWTTVAANLVAFGILDGGSGYPTMLSDKANSGTTAQAQTTKALSASTWYTLAIEYDGVNLHGYVDGKRVLTWGSASTTIPTGVALAPFFGYINGNGAGGNHVYVDYIRYAQER